MKKGILSALALSTLWLGANAQEQPGIIKVKGEAVLKAVPEELVVNIPIETRASTYELTHESLIKTFNELNAALVKAGIKKETIKSNRLNIAEDYQYRSNERVKVGYAGHITLYIRTAHTPSNLQKIMDVMKDPAYHFGYNVSFDLSEKQREELQAKAITDAVTDARNKANALVAALNLKLGDVKEVNYGYVDGGSDPIPMYRMVNDAMAYESKGLELNPDEIEIRQHVGIIWTTVK